MYNQTDLYAILDISHSASNSDIRKAYKIRAKNLHPDTGGNEEEFKKLVIAYQVLSDPDKRKQYDKTGTFNVDDERKQFDQAVNSMISLFLDVISKYINAPEFLTISPIDVALKACDGMLKGFEDNVKQLNHQKKQLNRVLQRLTFKGGGEGVLHRVVRTKMDDADKIMVQLEMNIKLYQSVREMFLLYDYHTLSLIANLSAS